MKGKSYDNKEFVSIKIDGDEFELDYTIEELLRKLG